MEFRIILSFYILLLIPAMSISSDYKIEVFKENYMEKLISGGGEVKMYHTLQVKTIFGNKLLILVGKDYEYRKWLRAFLKKHNLFILKIPDQGDKKFENEIAVSVDIRQIHPIWEEKWNCEGCRNDVIEDNKR